KPIVGRNFEAAVSGDVGGTGMEAKDIAMLVHLLIFLPVEDVGDGVDVTAERAAGERKLVQVALAGSGIHGVVDGVVADARRERARQDAVEGARAGNAAELQLLEEQLRGVVKGFDVGTGEAVGQTNASEGKLAQRVAAEDGEAGAVLRVVLNELRIDADGL